MNSPARAIDSFKETLEKVLDVFKIEDIFEYGPGNSTRIMLESPYVKRIDSLESTKTWFDKWNKEIKDDRVNFIYEDILDEYITTISFYSLINDKYDLIFVDAIARENILKLAKNHLREDGIIILHDSERPKYRSSIELYRHVIFEDCGNTALLTNSDYVKDKYEESSYTPA
jgi:predicted O-methyltransferase YrrM